MNKKTTGFSLSGQYNTGEPINLNILLSTRDILIVYLQRIGNDDFLNKVSAPPEYRPQCLEAADVLNQYLKSIEIEPTYVNNKIKGFKYKAGIDEEKYKDNREEVIEKIKKVLSYPVIIDIINQVFLSQPTALIQQANRVHKQSRAYAKTIAKTVGRDTSQPSLFSLPLEELQQAIEEHTKRTETGLPYKDKLSKNVGILGNILLKYHQDFNFEKDKDGFTSISDLSVLAKELHTDIKELKYYLLYLGGYQYPSVTYYEEEKEIGFQLAKLFEVEFIYSNKGKEKAIGQKNLIQSDTIQLLINTPIKRIRIKPSQQFLKDLEGQKGRALGYVNVNDNFVALCLGISDYAYKLLSFSYTNKPKYTISESKLLNNLGLEKQMKKQGPTKLRQQLAAAFKELKAEGHFKEYKLPFNDDHEIQGSSDLYSWTYTDKFIEHQDFKEKEKNTAVDYVDVKDKTIPLETRIKAFKAGLIKKGQTLSHINNAVKSYFKEELSAKK